ncbi:MAG: TonB family protein [Chryseolinea sp.]
MNAVLNYLLEANLGLCLFLLIYVVFLRNETDFKLKRVYMLFAVIASVVLPLFHFNTTNNVLPSLGDFVPPTWLPEVVVEANGTASTQETTLNFDAWSLTNFIYSVGVLASLILFIFRLGMLLKMIYKATTFKLDTFLIIESSENKSSFSFFQFIFIGGADQLSHQEREQIIEHERVHVQQLHSVDILLMNVLNIFFWFNPLIKMYKKIFIQLHEFEADARAVENRDVNDYCSLLAKVALLSADFKLANHFSNSLTLKRIEMMRTIKSKIRGWKIMAILLILPAFFFVVSCQDQIMDDAQQIAEKSTIALDLPEEVQKALDDMKKANPTKKFVALEVDENGGQKAEVMKNRLAEIKPEDISSINVMKNKIDQNGNKRSFIIIEYNEMTEQLSERSKQDGDIFTIVEESASPVGGMEDLGMFIGKNLVYPEGAHKNGLEGTVFLRFVVNKDGSLSDFEVVKGVDPSMDTEALRVAQLFSSWTPGKQNGMVVRQRFILPIRFKLNNNASATITTLKLEEVTNEFIVEFSSTENGDKKIVTGQVTDKNGVGIPGANVMNLGTTSGTVTDANGNFSIAVSNKSKGQLAVSFVGYKSTTIDF